MKRVLLIFSAPFFFYGLFLVVIAYLFFHFENKILPEETNSVFQANYEGEKAVGDHLPPKIYSDIEPQKPLAKPPAIIKAVYLTSWSAGNRKMIDYIINLERTTEINAVVIDIKDFSGFVTYASEVPEVKKYGAREVRILRLNELLKRLHEAGIYVIARQTVFQDPVLAKARPDLAVQSRKLLASSTVPTIATVWHDHKGLSWLDPTAREVWDYNIAIAKEAAGRGFDEINFDYIRFPSDGDMADTKYPFWDEIRLAQNVIRDFFSYLREKLTGIKISADLFGLATINRNDLGIGQLIENAYDFFDFVSPMVYPSHYAQNFLGYASPAKFPYEVIKYSLDKAVLRLKATSTTGGLFKAKLRPWLQDFNLLGVPYGKNEVVAEIRAVKESLKDDFNGFMLWSPANFYTIEALETE